MKTLTLALFASFGLTFAAQAASYSISSGREFVDFDNIRTELIAFDRSTSNDSHHGEFNLLIDGFDPDQYEITSAQAWFEFGRDDDRFPEWIEIDLGDGADIWGPIEVDDTWLGTGVSATAEIQLNETGILDYEISISQGDIYLRSATLVAWAERRTPASPVQGGGSTVPDGGVTGVLLGANLLGFALLRRKFRKR